MRWNALNGIKYVCFGASPNAMKHIEKLKGINDFIIDYICDNKKQLWGTKLDDYIICSPDNIAKEEKDNLVIIVTSTFFEEIKKQLSEIGVKWIFNIWDFLNLYSSPPENREYILQKFLQVKGTNTIEKFFSDHNITEFSIYSEDLVVSNLLYEELKDSSVKINLLLSDIRRDQNNIYEYISYQDHPDIIPEDEVIVAASPVTLGLLHNKNAISFRHILNYSYSCFTFYQPLIDFYNKYKELDISIYLVNHPTISLIHRPSDHEKLIRSADYDPIDISNNPSEYMDMIKPVFLDQGFDMEYVNSILNNKPSRLLNSYEEVILNPENKYKTIIMEEGTNNRVRYNPNRPEEYDNIIYILGRSYSFGLGAEDKHTIPSQLQKRLNDHPLNDRKYYVRNKTCRSSEQLLFDLKNLELMDGDIVFVYHILYEADKEVLKNNGFIFHDMQVYFERPHDLGEIFYDKYSHMNYKGYGEIADRMYELLENKKHITFNHIVTEQSDKKLDTHTSIDTDNRNVLDYDKEEMDHYIQSLNNEKMDKHGVSGSIVMNCNPFTNGHLFLIEKAAMSVDNLYIFVLEENRSYFPFEDRIDLVKKGVAHLKNVKVLPSGKFIISSLTFPEYFMKDINQEITLDASMDLNIFSKIIAPTLNITIRFVGDEPLCKVTNQYNQEMKRILPPQGIELRIIKRLDSENEPISASRVRALLESKEFDKMKSLVPETTYEYLLKFSR